MKAIAILLALIIGGCAATIPTTPQTPTERYLVADAAFKVIVGTVQDQINVGTLKGELLDRIAAGLNAANVALDVWGLAPGDLTSEAAYLSALRAVQSLLRTVGTTAMIYTPECRWAHTYTPCGYQS